MMGFPEIDGVQVWANPPEGYHVDFIDPQKDRTTVMAKDFVVVIGIFSNLLLGQHLYTAHFIRRAFGIEHVMQLLVGVSTMAFLVTITICQSQGALGVHPWEMSLEDAALNRILTRTAKLLAIAGGALAKLAFLVLWKRTLEDLWPRHVILVTAGVNIIAFAVVWGFQLPASNPIEATWSIMRFTRTDCHVHYPFDIFQAIIGILTDLILMSATYFKIVLSAMPWNQKAIVITGFSSSLFTLVATAIRLYILVTGPKRPDPTLKLIQVAFCWNIEGGILIICRLLPSLHILIKHFVRRKSGDPAPPEDLEMNRFQGLTGATRTIGGTPREGKEGHNNSKERLCAI